MEEENKTRIKLKKNVSSRVECLECQCIGRLRVSGDKILLFPEKVLNTRSMTTQKDDLQKPRTYIQSALEKLRMSKQYEIGTYCFFHFSSGNATSSQFGSYMILGVLFWGLIILSSKA